MASSETAGDRGSGLFGGLLAPLRLPQRVIEALEDAARSLEHVGPMHAEVVRVRKQSESLDQLMPALEQLKDDLGGRLDTLHERVIALEEIESHLDETVGRLVAELEEINTTIRSLQGDVERITDRAPDPAAPGPLARTRDAISGGG